MSEIALARKYETRDLRRMPGRHRILLFNLSGEAINADHGATVQAAREQSALLAGFDLKIHLPALHMINARDARDLGAQWGRSEMAQLDLNAHAALIRIEER